MLKKVIKSLLSLYILQLIMLSCQVDDCMCPTPKTFNSAYTNINATALQNTSTTLAPITSAILPENLVIDLSFTLNTQQISQFNYRILSNLGFQNAYACSCVPDTVLTESSIENITVVVTNPETNSTTNVTNAFKAEINGVFQPVSQIINFINHQQAQVIIKPTLFVNIPSTATFTITVSLENGNQFSSTTPIITFFD